MDFGWFVSLFLSVKVVRSIGFILDGLMKSAICCGSEQEPTKIGLIFVRDELLESRGILLVMTSKKLVEFLETIVFGCLLCKKSTL